MAPFKQLLHLFNLYRLDAALITFGGCLFGLFISPGALLGLQDVLVAMLVSLVSVNFIYALNSWSDRQIDAINKPGRPLPAGKISQTAAVIYVMALLGLSVIYPFFFQRNFQSLLFMMLFPVFGMLYSNPAFPFKKNMVLAALTTCAILTLPIAVGYSLYNDVRQIWQLLLLIYLYLLCVIPLKDIEDEKGDVAHGSGNWQNFAGGKKLLYYSLLSLFAVIAAAAFLKGLPVLKRICFVAMAGASFITVLFFLITNKNPGGLYKTLIRVTIVTGALALAVLSIVLYFSGAFKSVS